MVTEGLGEERWKAANKSVAQVVFMVRNSASRSTDCVRGLVQLLANLAISGPYLLVSKRVRNSQIRPREEGINNLQS
jgi:hypothetical protein